MPSKTPQEQIEIAYENNNHIARHTQTHLKTLNTVIKNYFYNLNHPYGYNKKEISSRFIPNKNQTSVENAKHFVTNLAADHYPEIADWIDDKSNKNDLTIIDLFEDDIVGIGYRIQKYKDTKPRLETVVTNMIGVVFTKTDDDNGFKIKTAFPEISEPAVKDFKNSHPLLSRYVHVEPTQNPNLLKYLEKLEYWPKLTEKEQTHIKSIALVPKSSAKAFGDIVRAGGTHIGDTTILASDKDFSIK